MTLLQPPPKKSKMVWRFVAPSFIFLCLFALVACEPPPSFSGPRFLTILPANVLTPSQPSSTFNLQNPTRGSVSWSFSLEQDPANPQAGDWFTLSQTDGILQGNGATLVTVRLQDNLTPGLYTATLSVLYQDKVQPYTVVGQIPGTSVGTARISGTVSTDNALIPVTEFPAQTVPMATATLPSNNRYVPGQILVKYKEPEKIETESTETESTLSPQLSPQQLEQRLFLTQSVQADYQLRVLEPALPGQADLLATSQNAEEVAQRLNRDPRVEYATPNYYLQALELPNDPNILEQWNLAVAGLPVAWQIETGTSNPVRVAVLDTGFDLNHEDLSGRFLPGYDFCSTLGGQVGQPRSCASTDDDPSFGESFNVHGTHVAGILGAVGNNSRGITGAAYGSAVSIVPVKIFDNTGNTATIDSFAKGIRWAVGQNVQGVPANPNPARIINLSLGGDFVDSKGNVNESAVQFMQDAVNAATNEGALIVAATGNNGERQNYVLSPAAANNVLGIGSVDRNLQRSPFSNFSGVQRLGPGGVDLMAPGNGILSTVPDRAEGNVYQTLSGTSMSTPLVSAIAALLLSREPNLRPQELESRLLAATYFDRSYMSESRYGKGVLRADLLFGLPGPNSSVAVAVGGVGSSAFTTTTLDVYGGTATFEINDLPAGDYRFIALSNGAGEQLFARDTLTLQTSETRAFDVILE
jgi:serine protease